MATFIKAKLKKSNGQIIIDKYKVAAHKTCNNIISEQKYYFLRNRKRNSVNINIDGFSLYIGP